MEINDTKKISRGLRFLYQLLLTVVAASLCVWFAYCNMSSVSVLCLAFLYLCCGYGAGISASLIYAGASAVMYFFKLLPDLYMMYAALLFTVIAILTAAAFKKQCPYRRIVTCLSFVFSVSIFTEAVWPAILEGTPVFTYLQATWNEAAAFYGLPAEFVPAAELYLPCSIIMGMMLSGAMTIVLYQAAKHYLKPLSGRTTEIKPMSPMRNWGLTKSFSIGLAMFALAAVVILIANPKNAELMLITLFVIASVPLMAQGFCTMLYALKTGCFRMFASWVFWVIMVAFFPASLYILLIIGLVDQFTRVRSRFPNGIEPPQE